MRCLILLVLCGAARAEDAVFLPIAKRDIPAGDVLDMGDLYAAEVPAAFVPANVVRSPARAVGRVVTSAIFEHEFLVEARLGAAAERALPLGGHAVVLPSPIHAPREPGATLVLTRPAASCVVARGVRPMLPQSPVVVVGADALAATLSAIHAGDVAAAPEPTSLPDCARTN